MRSRNVVMLLATLALSALALAACNDDDQTTCRPDATPQPTMANIWPHADDTQWVYAFDFDQHAELPLSASPPPLPSFEELHDALQSPVTTDTLETDSGFYRMRLEGDFTTESGVVAQRMVGEIYGEVGTVKQAVDGRLRLLRAIAAARPEYRAAIAARVGAVALAMSGKSLADTRGPQLLPTYAFAFEDSGYYGYGDLDTSHSWVYLTGDLAAGAEFSHQLVPWLTDDLWLYGRIWSVGDRTIDGRQWDNVVECMYVVDLGTQTVTDESGALLGYLRAYWYGSVMYVPGTGPVACDERHVFGPSAILQGDFSGGINAYRCRLVTAPGA